MTNDPCNPNTLIDLTKREYFAAMAMQGLLANSVYHNPEMKHKMIAVPALAEAACKYADALIIELNKDKADGK